MPLNRQPRKLRTFAPDVATITPDILTDGNNFVPVMQGLRTLPALHVVTQGLDGPCLGAAVITFPNGTQWIVAGTATSLNAIPSQSLDEITPPAWITSPIAVALINRWRFAYYHDLVIAVNGLQIPWVADIASLVVGAWTPMVGNPPIASMVASSDYSLFLVGDLVNTQAPFPISSDRWWSTVSSAPFNWTPDEARSTVTARIFQVPGPITALKALRSQMILYKTSGTWAAQLSGPPLIWTLTEISRQVGALSQEAVVSTTDIHGLLGPDDWYLLDGFSLIRVPNQHREWFFQRTDASSLPNVFGRFDGARSLIFWHFPVAGQAEAAATATEWLAFNVRTQQWTNGHQVIEMCPCAVSPDTIIDPTFGQTAGLFRGPDHTLEVYGQTGQGASPGSYFVTGDVGDFENMFQISRLRPGTTALTGTPNVQILSTYTPGGVYTPGPLIPLTPDGYWNCLNTARLQRIKVITDDDFELSEIGQLINVVGDR